jgi:hypothetical protein
MSGSPKIWFPNFFSQQFLMFLGRGMDSNLPIDDASDSIALRFTYRSLLEEPILYGPTRTRLYAPLRQQRGKPKRCEAYGDVTALRHGFCLAAGPRD